VERIQDARSPPAFQQKIGAAHARAVSGQGGRRHGAARGLTNRVDDRRRHAWKLDKITDVIQPKIAVSASPAV